MGGTCPEAEERRFFQPHEMIQVSGQIIIEVVEVPVAVAVPDASPDLFRNVPCEFGLISRPGLVEERLRYGRRSSRNCGYSKRRAQQRTRRHRAAIVE